MESPRFFGLATRLLFFGQLFGSLQLSLTLHLLFGRLSFPKLNAGFNEITFGLAQVVGAFGQPILGGGQGHASQQGSFVLLRRFPLAQSRSQPLLPGPEGAVGLHPAP